MPSIEGDEILLHSAINIGLAVDTDRGLLVPVIRNADHLSLLELTSVSADLVARTREGTVKAELLQGGTFTISNLGMYDIDAFTPILNLPQCRNSGRRQNRRAASCRRCGSGTPRHPAHDVAQLDL